MDKRVSLLVLAVLVAALIGCGGSGSNPELSKAEFIEQGNAICKEAIAEVSSGIEKVGAEGGSAGGDTSKPGGIELISSVFAPSMTKMAKELDALIPPKKDQAQVHAIVVAFEKGVKEAEADPDAALSKSTFTSGGELAGAYGLKACSGF